MKITDSIDLKVQIADIETLKSCITLGFYDRDSKEWNIFEISKYKNDLYKFIKFYNKKTIDRVVWFNGLAFDCQVIQFMFENYEKWFDKSNLEICSIIYEFVQKLIDDRKYGLFLPYRESNFEVPAFDVFTILGLDNEARMSSLKKVEFNLDMLSVEEMPIHHSREDLSREEIDEIISYMKNDISATSIVFDLVLGNTNHNLYKDNNQLELRYSIQEEFDINCLNYSDIKIGDELMKKSYAEAIGKSINDLPKKGTFRKEIKLKNCIPNYVTFKTPILQNLLQELKKKTIKQRDSVEKHLVLFKRNYVLAKGGLHAEQKNEIWEADENHIIEDDDVSSYYPKIIVNNGYYPFHLGKELLKTYTDIYNKRIALKPLSKKDKKIKGIVDALKLVCNAIFGKMGSMESWLFDMQALLSVTLTGELTLLMLLESFELNGISVISANTDGITSKFHKDKKELKDRLVKEWQDLTNFEIETVRFKKMYYSTVNDYFAIKDGIDNAPEEKKKDYIKTKGDFITDFELYKNKSSRIIPLALNEYFIKGKNPADFIKNHKNIYDFCIMTKASGDLHLEMQKINKNSNVKKITTETELIRNNWKKLKDDYWIYENDLVNIFTFEEALDSVNRSNNKAIEIIEVKKLVRYYLSSASNWQLYKRGIGTTGKSANISCNAPNEIGDIYITYFNQFEDKKMEDYYIDYNQYIYKTLKLIAKIEKNKKDKNFADSLKQHLQISMF